MKVDKIMAENFQISEDNRLTIGPTLNGKAKSNFHCFSGNYVIGRFGTIFARAVTRGLKSSLDFGEVSTNELVGSCTVQINMLINICFSFTIGCN